MTDPADLPVALPGYVPEPAALKALTHPLRLRLLDALAVRGRGTASQLGDDLGESSGATSYHLRQLARHGFIEEVAGAAPGRERWWQPITGGWTMPASMQRAPGPDGLTATMVAEVVLETAHQRVMRFLRGLTRWPIEWQRATSQQQAHLDLDPDQLRALGLEMEAVIERYRGMPAGPRGRRVRVEVIAYPVGDPPELPGPGA